MIVELGQVAQRQPRTTRRGVTQPPGEVRPVPTQVFVDYLDIAMAIGEKFYLLNAALANPLSSARYVSLSQIAESWGTREAMESRVRTYRRWIALRGGTYANEDYAGRVIWAYQRAFPEANLEDSLNAGELCLQLLTWTQANYPNTPPEFTCDVMLTMLGAYDIREEEFLTLPITTPVIPPGEEEEEEKDNKVLIAIIAVAFLALIRGGKG